jgi:hypothetical protein
MLRLGAMPASHPAHSLMKKKTSKQASKQNKQQPQKQQQYR